MGVFALLKKRQTQALLVATFNFNKRKCKLYFSLSGETGVFRNNISFFKKFNCGMKWNYLHDFCGGDFMCRSSCAEHSWTCIDLCRKGCSENVKDSQICGNLATYNTSTTTSQLSVQYLLRYIYILLSKRSTQKKIIVLRVLPSRVLPEWSAQEAGFGIEFLVTDILEWPQIGAHCLNLCVHYSLSVIFKLLKMFITCLESVQRFHSNQIHGAGERIQQRNLWNFADCLIVYGRKLWAWSSPFSTLPAL